SYAQDTAGREGTAAGRSSVDQIARDGAAQRRGTGQEGLQEPDALDGVCGSGCTFPGRIWGFVLGIPRPENSYQRSDGGRSGYAPDGRSAGFTLSPPTGACP